MANELTIEQISTVLNEVVGQATGSKVLAPVNGSQFATVAQIGLKCGYDTILNSISQVISRTIFSIRPYTPRFKPLMVSNIAYGNIVRKLNIADKDWKDNGEYSLTEGEEPSQFLVCLPKILQTNFYGQNTYERCIMIFRDQLNQAFSNAAEFGNFYSMLVSNTQDMIGQAHETLARLLVANFIAGKVTMNNGVFHLLTEYNERTGLALTAETVYLPDNYTHFMRFVASRVRAIKSAMTERTVLYHQNVAGKEISRHTPLSKQRTLIYAPDMYDMEASVLSDLFNPKYVEMGYTEAVNFWQSAAEPKKINIKPVYMKADGTLAQPENNVELDSVFGVIYDEEAIGMTVINNWVATTPLHARKGFWNTFYHFTDRHWTDFTENGVVLLLD